jgi:RNA polymerase sigma factor (sigma-70 family)
MSDTSPDFDYVACLECVRAGDQEAARHLVDQLYPLVIKIVRSHLPRRTQEEDLAQEVFMKMFSRLHQYQGSMPFPHWVSRIAVTTCIDQLRAQKRRPELRVADLSENEAKVLESIHQSEDRSTQADHYSARELLEHLLEQLNPEDQLVIRLMDLEQRSVEEVKEKTGWNSALIKVRAFRARRKLRKILEKLRTEEKL